MKYLLDTNICIYLIKKKPVSVIKRFEKLQPGDVFISTITLAELYYGVAKSSKYEQNLIALQGFLLPLEIIDFTKEDAIVYGKIRADLEIKGKLIGAMDLMIAALAINNDIILVTNNTKEFSRVPKIKIENWA